MKNYQKWMAVKSELHNVLRRPTFREGEVFWACIGENVGFEQDGKGRLFARPVLILKKFNKELFLGLPLTSQNKVGRYYYNFEFQGKTSTAILSQVRVVDSARLSGKRMGVLGSSTFAEIKSCIRSFF